MIPEITDYEVRRELLRLNKTRGLASLDRLQQTLDYLPITTAAMRLAAGFWSQARQQGQPTADNKALDADVILAAQAVTFPQPPGIPPYTVLIATTNVGHLSRFTAAREWHEIIPS